MTNLSMLAEQKTSECSHHLNETVQVTLRQAKAPVSTRKIIASSSQLQGVSGHQHVQQQSLHAYNF